MLRLHAVLARMVAVAAVVARVPVSALLLALAAPMLAAPACDCGGPPADDDTGDDDDGGEGEGEGECAVDEDCLDADPCTADRCTNGACTHPDALDGTPCGADPCTGNSACVSGTCTDGVEPDLDADDDGAVTAQCFGPDCDDNDPLVGPFGSEGDALTCADGKDNDCDGGPDALDTACGATELCDNGWCWENPRPHGLTFAGVWPAGVDDVWLAGQLGAGFAHFDGESFAIDQVVIDGFPAQTGRMWGASSTDVWAAAGQGMLHWDGSEWSRHPGSIGAPAVDVWGFASDDVWAVGFNRASHYDGIAWTQFDLSSLGVTQLLAVHGSAPDDVWATGTSGQVVHWNGTEWSAVHLPNNPQQAVLLGVFALAPDDVWAGGDFGFMWHFDGTAWTQLPGASNRRLAGIFGAASDDVWAVGDQGTVAHWNGSTWGIAAQLAPQQFFSTLRARAPNDMWAVGSQGLIARFDGIAWSRVSQVQNPVDGNLVDVAAVKTGDTIDVWAVGAGVNGAVIGRRDSSGLWHAEQGVGGAATQLTSVIAIAADDVWALGGAGEALHWNGTSWTEVPMAAGAFFGGTDACAQSSTEMYFSGQDIFSDSARIYRGDGVSWQLDVELPEEDFSNDPPNVRGVFCTGDDVYAGGLGIMLKRTDDGWLRQGAGALLSGGNQFRVFAAGPTDVWAMSRDPDFRSSIVMRFDGVDWTEVLLPDDVPAGARVLDISGTGPDDVWLSGQGFVLHWDGSALARVDMPISGNLAAIVALAPDDVVIVREDGLVSRWDGATLTTPAESGGTISGDVGRVFFVAADDGWAVSDTFGSTMFHWDGAAWTPDFVFPIQPNAVFGFATDDVWAVGERLEVAHWDGVEWTATDLSPDAFPDEQFVDVWGSGPNDVWALATDFQDRSTLWHNTGAGFVLVDLVERPRFALAGSAADDLWIFGQDAPSFQDPRPLIEHGDGAALVPYRSLEDPAHIQRVGERVLAIDSFSGVWERTPQGWVNLVEPTGADDPFGDGDVDTAWFIDDSFAYVNGRGGFRRFDGTSFIAAAGVFGFPAQRFSGVPVLGDENLWAVGFGGAVLHHVP